MPLHVDGRLQQLAKRHLMAFEDETVRRRDALEQVRLVDAKNQRVIEATWTLQNGAPARTPTQHRDPVVLAERKINFRRDSIRVTHHDKILHRLPNPQDLACGSILLRELQQRLLTRQVLRWRR